MLFLVAFGIKAAAFPLFFWLPASYHTPPPVVSAVFAGLLTKVGVYALVRMFTLLFVGDVAYTHTLILAIAVPTMLVGALGAIAQIDLRRLLSFGVVASVGYMLMGLGLLTPLALAGTVFYVVHDGVLKTCLFLGAGALERLAGASAIDRLGGLYRTHPWASWLFLVPALSFAGVPPLAGFFGKLALVQAGLAAGQGVVVAAALAASALTLLVVARVWSALWAPPATPVACAPTPALLLLPVAALAALVVLGGLAAEPLFLVSRTAADQLLDRGQYIRAVLGGSP
jgi:multicomponent Na+:H+ antiporter subunit D